MKNVFLVCFASVLLIQCTTDRTISPISDIELQTLGHFEKFGNQNKVQISSDDEAGNKLWLCLTFVSKESKQPLKHQKVKLYHTSSSGEYQPTDSRDESTARLNGSVITDENGQVFVQTILPGDYGSSPDNRHIHTTVENAQPEGYDIHFKQYTGYMEERFVSGSDQHFLANLKQTKNGTLVSFLTVEVKKPEIKKVFTQNKIPECEWCGTSEAPKDITWESKIASDREEGERLVLEGAIYQQDSTTLAEGIIVYAYHTNSKGIYPKKGDEKGNSVRHGYLRGWAKTNSQGRYRFHTIKPAPYSSHVEPAHVHMTLMGEEFEEYWINATWFEGDKIITKEITEKLNRTGGYSNIIELHKNDTGVWVGQRDIIIGHPEK